MPGKDAIQSSLPNSEIAICRRVREHRLLIKQGQPDFAKKLGVPRERLASYEHARAPIRFLFGYTLCQQFNISLRWLATGRWPQNFFTPIASKILDEIDHRELFSVAYENHLKSAVEARYKEERVRDDVRWAPNLDFTRAGVSLAESHLENVLLLISSVANKLAEDKKLKYAQVLEAIAFACDPDVGAIDSERLHKHGKDYVDLAAGRASLAGVKREATSWKELKRDIISLTTERGQRKDLAVELGVSKQVLGNWLSDARQGGPNAEQTLWLLNWVAQRKG